MAKIECSTSSASACHFKDDDWDKLVSEVMDEIRSHPPTDLTTQLSAHFYPVDVDGAFQATVNNRAKDKQ